MRVVHVTPAYLPNAGGIETLLSLLFPELKIQAGVDSAVFVGGPNIWCSEFDHEGIRETREFDSEVFRFGRLGDGSGGPMAMHLHVSAAVRTLLEQRRPAVVHIHGPSRLAYASYRSARALGIPAVLHIHGSVQDQFSPAFLRMCREAETVIAPSKYVAQSLRDHAGRRGEVHVCPNAIGPPVSVNRVRMSRQSNTLKLLVAGRLEVNKGHDVAIRCLRDLLSRGCQATLALFGEGPELQALDQLALSLAVRQQVSFNNPITNSQLLDEMEASDFVLVPSRGFEGFGLVAAEAASRATACIASDVGGLGEVVIHNVTGVLVPENDHRAFADAIENLVSDVRRLNAMRFAARDHAERAFGLERFVSTILGIYLGLGERN